MSRYHERPGRIAGIDACWTVARGERLRSIVEADASVDVVVRLGERGPRLGVERATIEALYIDLTGDDEVLGVRLVPGHGEPLRALEGLLAAEATALWKRGDLTSQALEDLVAARLCAPPAVVSDFVEAARERRGDLRLSGPGERALQRASRTWLGLRPKTLLRIERARAASRALASGEAAVDVAHDLGYSDQPHLTRELRALLGRTPSEIFKTAAPR
jgi:hypothetical protein